MTWNPILPAGVIILATLSLAGFAIFCLATAGTGPRRAAWATRTAVVLLVGLACLRPGIGSQPAPVVERSLDVVFVIDTTASMIAEDWNGDEPRLDGVREDVMSLAGQHAGARFALITFDSRAVQRLPFLADTSALQAAVDALAPEPTRTSTGSSIAEAHTLLHEVLRAAKEADASRSRVVYYLGDGEQTASKPPESFRDSADLIQGGAVLGYGTSEGGRMRETTTQFATAPARYIQDPAGGDARSRIDESNLETIAADLGVPYEHRTAGTSPTPAQVRAADVAGTTGDDVELAFDLYWILAIAAFALLMVDVARMTLALRELGRARGALPDD